MGISCWIAHKAVWSPENVATALGERSLSYAEFEGWVAHIAGYLRDVRGVKTGDRIAYLGPNSDVMLALFFACARTGSIFVPLNARLTATQLAVMIENAEPRFIFAASDFADTATVAAASTEATILPFGPAPDGTIDLVSEAMRYAPVSCDPNRDQNIPALIAYTSGTTGVPKGAVYTQDAITFSAINSNNCWNMRGTDHVLTYLPMFHVGGLLIHTLPAFHIGARVSITEAFEPGDALRRIGADQITLILAPPHFSRAMFQHEDWPGTDLSSLRCVGIGSTFVPEEVMQGWMARNVPTQQNYGLTEGVPALGTPFAHHRRKAHTAGLGMLYCQARVVDADMNRLLPGKTGEIVLRGRSLFSGYWRNPEADGAAFVDGWFRTGDLAFVDEEGYFQVVDRKKNIVVVGSSNVYPADLEKILDECPHVAEAAVLGCPDVETGEALVACVRPATNGWRDAETIRALFGGRLATYQHPKHVLFVEDFPRTSLGKIQRAALKRVVQDTLGLA